MFFDVVIFSINSSDIPLDFHDSILVVPLKYLMYFLAGINANKFEIFLKNILLHYPLRILIYIKYFVNPFVDIAFTSFNSLFISFLVKVTVFSFPSKLVFFTKLAISFSIAKFAWFSLAVKSLMLTYQILE